MRPAANTTRGLRRISSCDVRPLRAGYHGSGTHQFQRHCGRRDGQGEAISMDISDWRKKIDELDEQIVQLISKRAEAAKAIGELKKGSSLPVYEPGREQAVFDHIRAVNPGPLSGTEMQDVYERIIDVMRTLQRREG
jgi:chorismate mutase-like protein